MNTEGEIQAEDNQAEQPVAPVEPVKPVETRQPAPKSIWSKFLPWLIVALIFFVGGICLIYFTVYQTARGAAVAAQEEVVTLTQDLENARGEVSKAQADLQTAETELTVAETTIEEMQTLLDQSTMRKAAYKFLVDVNAARAALEQLDVETTRQSINFAKADLTDLLATDIDPTSLSGFADRLDEAELNLSEPELLKTQAALNTLYQNLLMLVNNLP